MSFLEFLFPPRIERLLENRDLQGLFDALQFKRGTGSKRAINYRRDAAKTLGKVALPDVIEPLIEALGDDPKVKRAARTALTKLTGKDDLGGYQKKWRDWLKWNEREGVVWLEDLMKRHRTVTREKHWKDREAELRENHWPEKPQEIVIAGWQLEELELYRMDEEEQERLKRQIGRWYESANKRVDQRVDEARKRLEQRWRREDRWVESFRKGT